MVASSRDTKLISKVLVPLTQNLGSGDMNLESEKTLCEMKIDLHIGS